MRFTRLEYSIVFGLAILLLEYLTWQGWSLTSIQTQCGPIFCQLGYSLVPSPVGIAIDSIVNVAIVYGLLTLWKQLKQFA